MRTTTPFTPEYVVWKGVSRTLLLAGIIVVTASALLSFEAGLRSGLILSVSGLVIETTARWVWST